jgi:hypothetical protein
MSEDGERKAPDTGEELGVAGRTEFLFKVISRLDFYINSTNTKASLIIAWNGLVIGTIMVKYEDIAKGFSSLRNGEQIGAVILALIGVAGVISIFLVLIVIYPYLKETTGKAVPNRSLVYFESIAAMGTDRYCQGVCSVGNEELMADLSGQAVALSDGLVGKMKKVKWAIRIVILQLVLTGFLVVLKMATYIDFSDIGLLIGCGK